MAYVQNRSVSFGDRIELLRRDNMMMVSWDIFFAEINSKKTYCVVIVNDFF